MCHVRAASWRRSLRSLEHRAGKLSEPGIAENTSDSRIPGTHNCPLDVSGERNRARTGVTSHEDPASGSSACLSSGGEHLRHLPPSHHLPNSDLVSTEFAMASRTSSHASSTASSIASRPTLPSLRCPADPDSSRTATGHGSVVEAPRVPLVQKRRIRRCCIVMGAPRACSSSSTCIRSRWSTSRCSAGRVCRRVSALETDLISEKYC